MIALKKFVLALFVSLTLITAGAAQSSDWQKDQPKKPEKPVEKEKDKKEEPKKEKDEKKKPF